MVIGQKRYLNYLDKGVKMENVNEIVLEKAKSMLGDLEKQLSEKLGKEIKLEFVKDSRGGYKVVSNDLIDGVPKFLKPLFKKIWLEGYVHFTDYGLGFSLDYQYDHPRGSNGYEMCVVNFLSADNGQDADGWLFRMYAE